MEGSGSSRPQERSQMARPREIVAIAVDPTFIKALRRHAAAEGLIEKEDRITGVERLEGRRLKKVICRLARRVPVTA